MTTKDRDPDRAFRNTTTWTKLSTITRARHPWCAFCQTLGRQVRGDVVGHIWRPAGDWWLQRHEDNLHVLCISHYWLKTAWESRDTSKPLRLGVGNDGFHVEWTRPPKPIAGPVIA